MTEKNIEPRGIEPCNGMNCGCTDGVSHSPECLAQTAATYAGGYFVKASAVMRDEGRRFKSFHRSLCDRFGYTHDDRDWRRDLVSLEEWIVKQIATPRERGFDLRPGKTVPPYARAGQPVNADGNYYAADGTFMNADGSRSIFDDVDEGDPEEGVEAVIACLGDDAATLRDEHPEIAANMDRAAELLAAPLLARALAEWHEDDGPVMWWAWNGHEWAGEPAWCGQPDDSDWPGYHTHWTLHPAMPAALTTQGDSHAE